MSEQEVISWNVGLVSGHINGNTSVAATLGTGLGTADDILVFGEHSLDATLPLVLRLQLCALKGRPRLVEPACKGTV